jgi:GT2 family glycosyltransferase
MSIIIVMKDNHSYSERCLSSIDAHYGSRIGHDYELVLVDNGSADGTVRLVSEWEPRARCIRLSDNFGFAYGSNVGAALATSSLLLFLNNDTALLSDVFDITCAALAEPGVGIVGARLLYPDGSIQHAGFAWRPAIGRPEPFHLFHCEPGDLPLAQETYEVGAVTGACLGIHRDLYHQVGGFDTQYDNGFEDVDLCFKVRRRGRRIVYRGDAVLLHDEGVTTGRDYETRGQLKRFRRQWRGLIDTDERRIGSLFGASVRPAEVSWPTDKRRRQLPPSCPARRVSPAPRPAASLPSLLLAGSPLGLSHDAAELRQFRAALARTPIGVAIRATQHAEVVPRMPPAELQALWTAMAKAEHAIVDGEVMFAPAPHLDVMRGDATLLRSLARSADEHWVASPEVACLLADVGVPEQDIVMLAPPIPSLPRRSGRAATLVLGVHDRAYRRALLRTVCRARPDLTIIPTVNSAELRADIESCAANCTLSAPTTCLQEYVGIVTSSEVVVVADDDPYQRRLLAAAATGATVIGRGGGSAHAVLGRLLYPLPADPDASAFEGWLAERPDRAMEDSRRAVVQERCGEGAVGRIVVERILASADRQPQIRRWP